MRDGIDQRLHYENPILWSPGRYEQGIEGQRLETTLRWIPDDVESVLDVGCGNGDLTNRLSAMRLAIGLDQSQTALQWVQVPRVQADIVQVPFADNAFDMVISAEVIEHLRVPVFKQALQQLARVARRYILVSVPYRENLEVRNIQCPQCKCRFHRYLHMRSFDYAGIENLFRDTADVQTIKVEAIVPQKQPRFVPALLYLRDQVLPGAFNIPTRMLCPQCGYSTLEVTSRPNPPNRRGSRLWRIKSVVKRLWPTETVYWWWLALFEKR
jgi:SAM-dependent methyltransferase